MIAGPDADGAVAAAREDPVLASLVIPLAESAELFERDAARTGLDFACRGTTPTGPNRARLKIFSPQPHVVAAFVYKDSQVPFSTDRFAYGALILKNRAATLDEVHDLINYLAAGLHPEKRPPELKRAFPFTIPR